MVTMMMSAVRRRLGACRMGSSRVMSFGSDPRRIKVPQVS